MLRKHLTFPPTAMPHILVLFASKTPQRGIYTGHLQFLSHSFWSPLPWGSCPTTLLKLSSPRPPMTYSHVAKSNGLSYSPGWPRLAPLPIFLLLGVPMLGSWPPSLLWLSQSCWSPLVSGLNTIHRPSTLMFISSAQTSLLNVRLMNLTAHVPGLLGYPGGILRPTSKIEPPVRFPLPLQSAWPRALIISAGAPARGSGQHQVSPSAPPSSEGSAPHRWLPLQDSFSLQSLPFT